MWSVTYNCRHTPVWSKVMKIDSSPVRTSQGHAGPNKDWCKHVLVRLTHHWKHCCCWWDGVSVHLGCYNRITQAGWLTNNRPLFLTAPLEAEKSQIKVLADLMSGERNQFLRSQRAVFSPISQVVGRSFVSLVHKGTCPIHEDSASLRRCLLTPSHWDSVST